jgi:hypothetical protein
MSPDTQTPFTATAPEFYSWRRWRPHPVLPALEAHQIMELAGTPAGRERLVALYNRRERLIQLSETPGQLIEHAFRLECWEDFDRDLRDAKTDGRDYGGIYVGGGKRSTKSSKAACTCMESWLTYGQGIAWAMQRTLSISYITMQRMIWEWMPAKLRAMNDVSGKRKNSDWTKIRYTLDKGFTESTLVLPNGTLVQFLTYEMEPKNFQGAEIGARIKPHLTARPGDWPWIDRVDANGIAYYQNGLPIPNIGCWLDEDAPVSWVSLVRDRCGTRNAKFIWTFTTENGITRAVRDTLGEPQNVETRPVNPDDGLSLDRVLVKGCPPGHVPYRQKTNTPGVNAIYFHSQFNIFGDNYANIAAKWRGKSESMLLANLYGYSEDIATRAFPLFSAWNIIDETELPADGTNYCFGDPAGTRNWAWIWVRLCPGSGGTDWYIYDEWPNHERYGDWAVPDERPAEQAEPDGLAGPAQRGQGWGVEEYKRMVLERERIRVPQSLEEDCRALLKDYDSEPERVMADIRANLRSHFADPMRQRIFIDALQNGDDMQSLRLTIRDRYLDPRAGATKKEQDKGSKTLFDLFNDETRDALGNITGPRMFFRPAPGLNIEQVGLPAVQKLLAYDDRAPIVKGLNAPRLRVVSRCRQVRWMFENYTAQGGSEAGGKDFADLVRYMATSPLRYIAPGALQTKGGGRSY